MINHIAKFSKNQMSQQTTRLIAHRVPTTADYAKSFNPTISMGYDPK
jgi:hypothetical protein